MATYEDGYDPKYGYNRNAWVGLPPHVKFIGGIVRGIAAPFGLASEAIAHNKQKKRAATEPKVRSGSSPTTDEIGAQAAIERLAQHEDHADIEPDEADWALDEIAAGSEDDKAAAAVDIDVRDMIESISGGKALPTRPPPRLPFPVVLSQRRPGTKTRGFVRAYAPVLEGSGIDQAMFLNFLKSFHTASQASPIFDIIILASSIAGAYPNGIAQAVTIAVQSAARAGQEVQERWRTNRFLDSANKEIFMPRGLYALIVAYKPGAEDSVESKTIDLGAMAVAKYGGTMLYDNADRTKIAEMKEKMKRLRVASGHTHGEAEMPVTCAPLVFPALEAATGNGGNESKVAGLQADAKGAGKYVNDYFDRRAQAVFITNNKDTTLAKMQPTPKFASKMADPNDARNTHLITLVTGGLIKAEPFGGRRRWEKAQRKAAERRAKGLKTKSTTRGLKENVLYLMVVNMPTEHELEAARREMKEAKERKKAERRGERSTQDVRPLRPTPGQGVAE